MRNNVEVNYRFRRREKCRRKLIPEGFQGKEKMHEVKQDIEKDDLRWKGLLSCDNMLVWIMLVEWTNKVETQVMIQRKERIWQGGACERFTPIFVFNKIQMGSTPLANTSRICPI